MPILTRLYSASYGRWQWDCEGKVSLSPTHRPFYHILVNRMVHYFIISGPEYMTYDYIYLLCQDIYYSKNGLFLFWILTSSISIYIYTHNIPYSAILDSYFLLKNVGKYGRDYYQHLLIICRSGTYQVEMRSGNVISTNLGWQTSSSLLMLRLWWLQEKMLR